MTEDRHGEDEIQPMLPGGFWISSNRWYDAGYARQCNPSVTSVYMFLNRWASNNTRLTKQPMRLIAMQCGLSERVARRSVRILEAWGVIHLHRQDGRNKANTWTLNQLSKQAPTMPDIDGQSTKDSNRDENDTNITPQENTTLHETYRASKGQLTPDETFTLHDSGRANSCTPLSNKEDQTKNIYSGKQKEDATPKRAKRKEKPLPENGTAQQIVKAFCDAVGIDKPVNYRRAVGQAQMLADAGIGPEDMAFAVQWCNDQSWIKGGFDLGLILSQADKWRVAKKKPAPIYRHVV